MGDLYHVTVQRRGIAAQMQLNYTTEAAAKAAFERLVDPAAAGLIIEDSFGSMIAFDPEDIGHVMFLDAQRVLDMRTLSSLMEARAQAAANRLAQRDPELVNRNGLLVPSGPINGIPTQ